jgi:chromosome partitioning protein
MGQARASDCIVIARENLDLLPSSLDLWRAQQRLVLETAREDTFALLLSDLTGHDYVLLDCAPAFSLLTVNALSYADEILVVVSTEALALASAQQALSHMKAITKTLGSRAAIRFVVPTFYDARRRMSQAVLESLGEEFGERVTHPIRVDTKLAEAPGAGQTVFEYSASSRGAKDYARLAELIDAELSPSEQSSAPTRGRKGADR